MQQLSASQQASAIWDGDLVARYDLAGPRYTSYPTAPQFREDFEECELDAAIARSNRQANPLSLYFHIPFCSRVCYYCACNKIVTANRQVAGPYLARLEKEMALMAARVDASRPVHQLHWGGGTPTFLSDDEKRQLMAAIGRHFNLLDDDQGEYALEVHPGDTSAESIRCLRELGFNRLSMGVQDFDPGVQEAINRFNSEEEVRELVTAARELGFHSIGMDLIYGLPHQTVETFNRTLDAVIALEPDRLSLFSYAHMPHLFKTQKQMQAADMPGPAAKLEILHLAIERMLAAGYVYIGMDHFARPGDALAVAQREGKLQRNFQGYATHGDCDLLAFGVSAISAIGDTFSQNHKDIAHYNRAVDSGTLPLARGLALTADDRIRARVIAELVCHFCVEFSPIEHDFDIDFGAYFAPEIAALQPLQRDGLVRMEAGGIQVTDSGRLLIRRICMVFDAWLERSRNPQGFSRIL